jgi:hypothetical protein
MKSDIDTGAYQLLGMVRMLRAGERGYLAAALHDGPIQDLAAATLELNLAGDDAESLPQRLVEAAGRSLRRLVDELAPPPAQQPGLAEALNRRTGWLGVPLVLDLDEGVAGLSAAEIETVADLVELMLFAPQQAGPQHAGSQHAGPQHDDAPPRALGAVQAGDDQIAVEMNMTPATESAWLDRLATAMQSEPDVDLHGHRLRARMRIPRRRSGT